MKKETDFKGIVNKVVKDISDKLVDRNDRIEKAWQEAVEDKIKKNTAIEGVKEDVLYIKTNKPAWIYEIKKKKKEIVDTINLKNKKTQLKDIIIKLGDI
jgi:predicted nucleic acid-binding Zn ribbon protein